MKPKLLLVLLLSLLAAGALVMTAQNANFNGVISGGNQLKLAVPDFRATPDARVHAGFQRHAVE